MVKISELPSDNAPDGADLIPFLDVTASTTDATTVTGLAASPAFTDAFVSSVAILTTDGDVLTRTAGVPARITRANLAADAAFTTAFASSAAQSIWVPAASFNSAAAARGIVAGRWDAWSMTTSELVNTARQFPSDWSEFYADVYWANATTSTGNVSWTLTTDQAGEGETISATGPTTPRVTVAAGGQWVRMKTRLTATALALDSADLTGLRVTRSPTLDTLGANDVAFLGLMLGKE